jgi:hypothetical protein
MAWSWWLVACVEEDVAVFCSVVGSSSFLSFGVFFIMWALLQWGLEMGTEERTEENKKE